MAEQKEKLFSEFEPVSTEAWIAKITADLKGVPFEKSLFGKQVKALMPIRSIVWKIWKV